jgi:hydrogenase maturation protease
MPAARSATLIVGIGNPDRGDDAVGRLLARRFAHGTHARVVECDGEPAALLDALAGSERAVIVDAAEFGAEPGTVLRLDVAAAPLPGLGGACSTHGLGVGEALELGRALGRLPARCVLFAIQGERYEPGTGLSANAARALDEVERRITGELRGP